VDKPKKIGSIDLGEIRQMAIDIISESEKRITPGELEKTISHTFGTEKKAFKTAIKRLVEDNELAYTYQFGRSFLEKSFNKPTRISDRIVLKPPAMMYEPSSDEIVIDLQQGASFGTGEHPTTRLAIRGIEHTLSANGFFQENKPTLALDIGTGSGILAIAAVSLGITRAIGIDIDPCALAEAKKNARLNNLENRIAIHDRKAEQIDKKFSLITANLRFPTLKRICSHLTQMIEQQGVIVVSGIKTNEISNLSSIFTKKGFCCAWKEIEKDWAGVVFDPCLSG